MAVTKEQQLVQVLEDAGRLIQDIAGLLTILQEEEHAPETPTTRGHRARVDQSPAPQADGLPFPEFAQVRSSDRTTARRILRGRDSEQLKDALRYEKSHRNRAIVVRMVEQELGRRRSQSRAEAMKPTAAPFAGYDKVQSGKQTAARRYFGSKSADTLTDMLAYEQANQNRSVIRNIIETQLRKKTRSAAPAAATAPAAKAAPAAAGAKRRAGRPTLAEKPPEVQGTPPFPEYVTWSLTATARERNSRTQIAAMTDPDQVAASLAFEQQQNKPRSTIVNLLTRRYRALTGAGAAGGGRAVQQTDGGMPVPGYEVVQSSEQTKSRAFLNAQDLPTLRRLYAWEQAGPGRVQVVDMIANAIKRKETEAVPLPFPEYAEVASSRQQRAKEILRSRSVDELTEALTYERTVGKRVQIERVIEDAMARQGAAPPSANGGQPAAAGAALPLPFPGYANVASSRETDSRKILAPRSDNELRAALAWEGAQPKPRKKIINLINTQLRKRGATEGAAAAPAVR